MMCDLDGRRNRGIYRREFVRFLHRSSASQPSKQSRRGVRRWGAYRHQAGNCRGRENLVSIARERLKINLNVTILDRSTSTMARFCRRVIVEIRG